MRTKRFLWLAMILSVGLSRHAFADTRIRSADTQVALLELYTSEGCSSCPPAETWLSELRADKDLWTKFVPIAFHVSYWDSLGWRDPFSSKELTRRQYALAEAWRAPSVYTPCFVLNGQEWHAQREALTGNKAQPPRGILELIWRENGTCTVSYAPKTGSADNVEANVALLGGDISMAVRAGENAGRTLRHDFVAIQVQQVKLQPAADGTFQGEVKLNAAVPPSAKRRALAAWVVTGGQLQPVQSVGGWID